MHVISLIDKWWTWQPCIISILYNLRRLIAHPTTCGYGTSFSVEHALTCPKGGFLYMKPWHAWTKLHLDSNHELNLCPLWLLFVHGPYLKQTHPMWKPYSVPCMLWIWLKHITIMLASASQTQPTPAQITFNIMHVEGRVWWLSVGFCVLCDYVVIAA